MNAIEILRAASSSVPNEDYVQFMAAVEDIAELIEAAKAVVGRGPHRDPELHDRLHFALAKVGGPA